MIDDISGGAGLRLVKTVGCLVAALSVQMTIAEPYVLNVEATTPNALTAARDQVRALRADGTITFGTPVEIVLAPGTYQQTEPLILAAGDSGAPSAPVVWRAASRGTVRISRGQALSFASFVAPTDAVVKSRLPPEALGHVLVADISAVVPTGGFEGWQGTSRTLPFPILTLNGRFEDVARWPNRSDEVDSGWAKFTEYADQGAGATDYGWLKTQEDRAARWDFKKGVWLFGYWWMAWRDDFVKVASWDAETKILRLGAKLPIGICRPNVENFLRYFAVNLPEELDAPGEYWVDYEKNQLYYYPSADAATGELALLAQGGELVRLGASAHDIVFRNLAFDHADQAFVSDTGLRRIRIETCDFRVLRLDAVSLNGSDNVVADCFFRQIGQRCVCLSGGDRKSLRLARNVVERCDMGEYARFLRCYTPAVRVDGCGSAVRSSFLHDAPHQAIAFEGNEHFLAWNNVSNVVNETSDASAFYTYGDGNHSSLLSEGNKIVGNRFEDTKRVDTHAVYFDGGGWGGDVIANVFERVTCAVYVGGDLHVFDGNVTRNCSRGYFFTDINQRMMHLTAEEVREMFAPYAPDRCPWSAAYPAIIPTIDENATSLWNNVVTRNLFVDCEEFTASYQASFNEGFHIRDNATVSTDGSMAGVGVDGFTHYANQPANESMVPGLSALKARAAALASAPTATAYSPDGQVAATFGLDVTGRLCCQATIGGETLVGPSSMGVTVDGIDYGSLVKPDVATVTAVAAGKAVDAASGEGYTAVSIPLERMLDGDRSATLEARVFDNGIAWRMRVAGSGPRQVAGGVALWDVADGNCTAVSAVNEPFETTDEVTTGWSYAVLRAVSVADQVLTVDIPDGETRALSQPEAAVLVANAVTNVVKAGGGTLRLTRDLTGYAGCWNVSSGQVQVCVGTGAFGSAGEAPVRLTAAQIPSGAACLTFLASGTVERPIDFVRAAEGDRAILAVDSGVNVRMLRAVRNVEPASMRGVAYMDIGADGLLAFESGYTNTMAYAGFKGAGTAEFRHVPSKMGCCFLSSGAGCIRFATPRNIVWSFDLENTSAGTGRIELACADALSGFASTGIATIRNGVLDLQGHDVICGNLAPSTSRAHTGGALTSVSPATLSFSQSTGKTNLACAVSGALSLQKRGSAEFAVGCPFTSTGSLTVSEGAFRILPTGSWKSVSSVEVGEQGTLILENPQAFDASRTTLSILSASARVLVADGMSLPVAGITYLGTPLEVGRTYGGPGSDADVKLDVFGTGTGVLRVFEPGTYTWSGAAEDGDWTNPLNWGKTLSGDVPIAGDTAVFATSATINSDFVLGGGADTDVLTIDIADGVTVTIDASISGTGGVIRRGNGALKLKRANPFTGTFVSTPTSPMTKGHTYVYDAGALGLSAANFNPVSGCAAVHFDASDAPDGTLVFDIPIRISTGSTAVDTYNVYFANGRFVFNKPLTASGRMSVSASNVTEVRFREKLTVGSWLDMGSFAKACHFYYEKGLSSGVWYHAGSEASHHIWTSDNSFNFSSTDSYGGLASITLVCESEDVFRNCTELKSFGWRNGFTGTAYVNLKGRDQRYPTFANGCILKTEDFGFASPIELPEASVILSGNYVNDLAFNGQFKGKAGLTWNPTVTTRAFMISNVVSSTRGALKALSGVLRLKDGTSFSSLSSLEIGATGQFVLEADAGDLTEADAVIVAEGGVLAVSANKTVKCRSATYEGQTIAEGVYPRDGALSFLTGDGSFVVDSTVEWSGGASGDWDEPSNWMSGEVPSAGQNVRIGGSAQVSLTGTTARLARLTLAEGATLVMTDWNACLAADDVRVGASAKITTDGPFMTADDAPASRVHIVCGTLTVDAGGAIDVKAKGWKGGVHSSANAYGYGPGSPRNVSKFGAAHGGYGAIGVHTGPGPGRMPFGVPYDDPHAPVLPGSGAGSNSSSYPGTSGGGAVLIEATGAVVVNGQIDASAGDSSAINKNNLTNEKCGSGGSIWIKSATVTGVGVILANGGNGDAGGGSPGFYWSYVDPNGTYGGPLAGGGGMIRIEYGAGQQTVTDNALVVSAACGYYAGIANGSHRLPAAYHDKYRSEADLGTLTFTDTTLVDQLLGKGLAGRLVDVREYTYDGDLEWTSGHVRFATEGVDVRITGDLTIRNDSSRLEIGGIGTGTNRSVYVDRYAGKLFNKLTVGGDLSLLDGSALDIRAAEKSAAQPWGGEVSVAGDFTVGAGSYLYPWCDVLNTGAPHFTVGGAFTLAEGATVMADRRGGAPGHNAGNATAGLNGYFGFSRSTGYGTGYGSSGGGGGHGGVGGRGVNNTSPSGTAGAAVDNEWEPVLPGAGGGSGGYGEGGEGGGLFHLTAQGPVVVNGTITAEGFLGAYSTVAYGYHFGSGAGGGVYLAGASFAGGSNARISVRGGPAISVIKDEKPSASGCGGGGRVSIVVGMDQKMGPHPHVTRSESASTTGIAELYAYAGVIDVGGGTNVWSVTGKTVAPAQVEQSLGGAGTIRYSRWSSSGMILLFR